MRLHAHSNTFFCCSCKQKGVGWKVVPAQEPSHTGCFSDKPHVQYWYVAPRTRCCRPQPQSGAAPAVAVSLACPWLSPIVVHAPVGVHEGMQLSVGALGTPVLSTWPSTHLCFRPLLQLCAACARPPSVSGPSLPSSRSVPVLVYRCSAGAGGGPSIRCMRMGALLATRGCSMSAFAVQRIFRPAPACCVSSAMSPASARFETVCELVPRPTTAIVLWNSLLR